MGTREPDTMLGTGAAAQPTPAPMWAMPHFDAAPGQRRMNRLKMTVRITLMMIIVTIGK